MTTHHDDDKNWVETVDNIAALDAKKDVHTPVFIEGTDEEKKLVRKIDLFLMPTIWVLYCFSYMDRTNIVSISPLKTFFLVKNTLEHNRQSSRLNTLKLT